MHHAQGMKKFFHELHLSLVKHFMEVPAYDFFLSRQIIEFLVRSHPTPSRAQTTTRPVLLQAIDIRLHSELFLPQKRRGQKDLLSTKIDNGDEVFQKDFLFFRALHVLL